MSTEKNTKVGTSKKKKWPKLPFLSFTDLQQWSKLPFTESLQTLISDMQTLVNEEHCLIEEDPFKDLALLFTRLQEHNSLSKTQELDLLFVNQTRLMGAREYIKSIVDTKQIPLKPHSNHDLFNASMWITLPRTRLMCAMAMHHAYTLRSFSQKNDRSSLEDRFTLFDESGIALFSDDLELIELINSRSWKRLFFEEAERCQAHLKLWIVGHGLYEQLLRPFIGLVGYGRCYHVDSAVFGYPLKQQELVFDQIISQDLRIQLNHQVLELSAIPILGFPSWWPNQTTEFYDNQRYFRGPYPNKV